jgi:hypothetical protein
MLSEATFLLSRTCLFLFGEDMMMSNQLYHRSPKRKERDNDMKAIRMHGRGGPERLVYEDVPQPHPGQGEVLVRVYALTAFDRDGAQAEYTIAFPGELAPKPRPLDYVQAAAVPLTALTAWQAFFVVRTNSRQEPSHNLDAARWTDWPSPCRNARGFKSLFGLE